MHFVDKVTIECHGGKGGDGIVSWRREKYIPKGGPYGGNGGNGGSISILVDSQASSLDAYRHKQIFKAENGLPGGANRRKGRRGRSLELKVPTGTVIRDAETEEILYDLIEENKLITLCSGGYGGRGNASFATSTNRGPKESTPGTMGSSCKIILELKIIADVGFVGFPNAGKSSIFSNLTTRDVKIAPYPFTTLTPNIGYIQVSKNRDNRITIADIPGIIADAHKSRGLGLEFLRHIERTKVLVFILDASGIDGRTPLDDYFTLTNELRAYNKTLLNKPSLIVLNKQDDPQAKENSDIFKAAYPHLADHILETSFLSNEGLDLLQEKLIDMIKPTEEMLLNASFFAPEIIESLEE
jgi:GTPase